ncbi:MAG: hypothetical protein R3F49_24400 [Planctomycetota bacterium]
MRPKAERQTTPESAPLERGATGSFGALTRVGRRAGPRKHGRWGARVAAVACAALLVAACGGPSETFEANWDQRGGTFGPKARIAFAAARAQIAAGDLDGARRELEALCLEDPGNIEAGAWLQDVELDLLAVMARGARVIDTSRPVRRPSDGAAGPSSALADPRAPSAGPPSGSPTRPSLATPSEPPPETRVERCARASDPSDALRREYEDRARAAPSASNWVLAARLAATPEAALQALDTALSLDPRCAWAHYARAHALIRSEGLADRWSLARAALDAARELEPGFLRARRLRAWMLAEEGQRQPALAALDAWLVASEDDPRVPHAQRVDGLLDHALLLLLDGRAERARDALIELEGEPIGRGRRLALLAVAEQERDELERSLAAIRRAEGAEPGSVLPLVQRALLLERFQDDPAGAEELWRAIAERESASDLADLVQTMRARVRLERRVQADALAEDDRARATPTLPSGDRVR